MTSKVKCLHSRSRILFLLHQVFFAESPRPFPARIVRQPKWLSLFREGVFCEFEPDEITFVGWEPFGDNDVYRVGLEPTRWVPPDR